MIFSVAMLWLAGCFVGMQMLRGRRRTAAVSLVFVLAGFTVVSCRVADVPQAKVATTGYVVAYPEQLYHAMPLRCQIGKRSVRQDNRIEFPAGMDFSGSCLAPCPYCIGGNDRIASVPQDARHAAAAD
jgi:hypothetical protein